MDPGECCPYCPNCKKDGEVFKDGDNIPDQDPCTKCKCEKGDIICASIACPFLTCTGKYLPPGECCEVCPPGKPMCSPILLTKHLADQISNLQCYVSI